MSIYLRPDTLEQALAALGDSAKNPPADTVDRLTVLAGATDFLPAETTRSAWFQPSPRNILDIGALKDLRGLAQIDGSVRIGCLTTWSDIINADLPAAFDGLKQASRQVGGVQIQNRGTIGGNLCNASPAADGVPPLLALDAEVELTSSSGTRRLPLGAFILGNRRTALRADELLTAIVIPQSARGERAVFAKLGARSYLVISIASVAVNLVTDAQGRIELARIAVGACSAVPQRLTALEQRLTGGLLTDAASMLQADDFATLAPLDDIRASAAYRRSAAITLVRRALQGFVPHHAVAA
jgi:CO/xanthine dehydrogenase FAD-binding subunit